MLLLLTLPVLIRTALAAAAATSNGTSTSPPRIVPAIDPSPTPAAEACPASCEASAFVTYFTWAEMSVATTVTAATVVVIIDSGTNSTSSSTIFNSLPPGLTPPPTNSAGSQTAVVTAEIAFDDTVVTTLTFPTGLVQSPVDYIWSGTLSTTDSAGAGICSTATNFTVPYTDVETATVSTVQAPTDPADPGGLLWTLISTQCEEAPDTTLNPGDAAPTECSVSGICPVSVKTTVMFLTDFSTIFTTSMEGGAPPTTTTTTPLAESEPTTSVVTEESSAAPTQSPTEPVLLLVVSTTSSATAPANTTILNIGGQTLAPGSTIVIGSGTAETTIAIETEGGNTAVVVGSETIPALSNGVPLPSVIVSGLGGNASVSTSSILQSNDADGGKATNLFRLFVYVGLLACIQVFLL